MKTAAATCRPPSPPAGGAARQGADAQAPVAPPSPPRLQGTAAGLGAAPRRSPQVSAHDAAQRTIAELAAIVGDRTSPSPSPLPPPAPVPKLTAVVSLGQRHAAEFASSYVSEHLAAAPPGTRALVLADGAESSGAATWAIDHPHLATYSADCSYQDAMENVEFWGAAYTRVRIDHTQPLATQAPDGADGRFSGILMLRGLCDHCEWKDSGGGDAGPVGCAAIPLTPPGIHSLLSGIAPMLSDHARFALHGEINPMDRQAEHPALSAPVQAQILEGVERFNLQVGHGLASVHVGESGLVIAGGNVAAFTAEQLAGFGRTTDAYFSQDRSLSCDQYPNDRPSPGAAPG